jgi:alkanesulfonate monooxygenase SsuD/methylene tetrahydromethanopterin reductase-like flavin-dependent oxidoreductase (luciferase family)
MIVTTACYRGLETTVKFGLDVGTTGRFSDARLLAGLAADAEAAGWDGFFIWDILLGGSQAAPEPVVDPWVALTAIALATSRIRFGAFMTPLARRRPWDVARCVASLDQLSGGRIILGAGLGYREDEFAAIGEDTAAVVRAGKLDEGLAIIDQLWRGRPVTFTGQHYRFGPAAILPAPCQKPRVPVWTAAGWPRRRPLHRAARWDGTYLMTVNQESRELLRPDEVTAVRDYLTGLRGGSGAFDIAINGDISHAGQPADALARYEQAGATWWVELCSDTPEQERDRIRQGPPRR